MKAPTRGRWLGIALATGLGFSSFTLATEAEAAPTPGNKIRGRGGNFGLGVSLGDPMGLSLKYFLAANHALQGDLGWAPLHHGNGRLGMDYLWHPATFVSNSTLAAGSVIVPSAPGGSSPSGFLAWPAAMLTAPSRRPKPSN